MVQQIDKKYSKFWVESGATMADVKRVAKNVGAGDDIAKILDDNVAKKFTKGALKRKLSVTSKLAKALRHSRESCPSARAIPTYVQQG